MDILVSINCITYNHEKYIRCAIESFLKQKTNFEFEIVIGEDCSTDNTMKIVREYEKKYPEKIVVVTSSHNVGMMENEKRVIKASRGKYIAECEGDDYWTDPYKLQKQVDYMEKHKECTLCFHNADMYDTDKNYKGKMISSDITKVDYDAGEMIKIGFIPTASRMYRKFTMDNPPSWYIHSSVGDFPSQVIITSYGYAHYIPSVMSVYRVGVENSAMYVMQDGDENQLKTQKGRIETYNNLNNFLDYVYDPIIKECKRGPEFVIAFLNGDIATIKKDKYKEFYEKLSIKNKIRVYVQAYLSPIYVVIRKTFKIIKYGFYKIEHR